MGRPGLDQLECKLLSVDTKAKFADIGLDSLDATAVITSLEHEFHIVFEDKVFENLNTLNHVKSLILTDHNAF